MRRFSGLAVLLLGGCQLVFPLKGDSEPEPPETPTVHGSLVSAHVENDVDGLPQFSDTAPIVAGATVFFEDRTSIEVDVADDGTFVFDRTTQHYRLQLIRGIDIFEIQDEAETLKISYDTVGRFPQATTETDTFIQGPPITAGTSFTMLGTTGQWSNPSFEQLIDWRNVGGIGNLPLTYLSASAGDRLYYLEFTTVADQSKISKFLVEPYEMTPGETHKMVGTPAAATTAGCTRFAVALAEQTEIKTAVDDYVPGFASIDASWAFKSQPSLEIGNLAQLTVVQGSTLDLAFQFDVAYPNPFPGHHVVAAVGVAGVRGTLFPGTANTAALQAFTEHLVVPPAGDCPASMTVIDNEIGFPTNVLLDGNPLLEDGRQIVFDRPGTARLTWDITDHPVDYYDVTLSEVTSDAGFNTTNVTTVARYRTREQHLDINSSTLQVNHLYVAFISPVLGTPDASKGDYTKKVFPLANAQLPTATFKAQ